MCELPKAKERGSTAGTLLCFCQFLFSDGRRLRLATKAARAEWDNKCFSPPSTSAARPPWCGPSLWPDVGSSDLHLCKQPRWWPVTSVGTPEQEMGTSIVTSHLLQLTSDTDVGPVHLAHSSWLLTPWRIHDLFTPEIVNSMKCRFLSCSFCQYYQRRLIMLHL